ncbi:Sensorin-A [Bulinus truncatus]|nr:Sensorin-A [Bulinus truncatus]
MDCSKEFITMSTNSTSMPNVHFLPVFLLVLVTCCTWMDITSATKYRVGYLFGKRGVESPSTNLFDIVSRDMKTKQELESIILKRPEILSELLTILDRNDDGYITPSDLI